MSPFCAFSILYILREEEKAEEEGEEKGEVTIITEEVKKKPVKG